MFCKSCKEDIPSKFKHALSVNICPFCGEEIMTAELQSILNDLKSVMDRSKDYLIEIEGWLYANFSFKKIDPNQVVIDKDKLDFLEKKSNSIVISDNKQIVSASIPDEPHKQSIFEKRAGVSNHKKSIEFIKGNIGAADPSEFQGTDEEEGEEQIDEEVVSNPLSSKDINNMNHIFNDKASQNLEIQRLKLLQAQQQVNGGGGRGSFRRG